jgi:hypothetical protein
MLQKQPVDIRFSQGLDTKTDPYQVTIGKFLTLVNSIFTTGGRLTKRPGFSPITNLPNTAQTTLTTLNDNLIATGSNLYAFSEDTNQWLNTGIVQPVQLNVLPIVRTSTSQTSPDAAVSASGLVCVVYADSSDAYYQIVDSVTGQQIVNRTQLPATAVNARVFLLGVYFIITFTATVSGASHLRYIAIPTANPLNPGTAQDIITTLTGLNIGYDGYVANNNLYLAYANAGSTINVQYLTSTLILSSPAIISGHTSTLMSVTVDTSASTAVVWATFWDSSSTNGYTTAFNQNLTPILAATQVITTTTIEEITSVATNSILSIVYENLNTYASPYPVANIRSDFLSKLTVTQSGTVSSTTVLLRSVGLGSKAFIAANGTIYMLADYGDTASPTSSVQPTYFLIDFNGNIYMRLAYANGGGYESSQVLPTVSVLGTSYYVPYLFQDFLVSVNKNTNLPSGTPTNGLYTQTGVNLAEFSINTVGQLSSEIAGTLNLTGGQLWEYDASKPVENNFQVWPENVQAVWAATGGSIVAIPVSGGSNTNAYYYQVTYEWTNNQGNIERSAPSIPLAVTTTGSASTGLITLYVPNLRLTYKTSVRIIIYRWSQGQQNYYEVTSVTSPTISSTTSDFTVFQDTQSDAEILGNTLIYTTGGVVEDIAAPPCIASTLYNTRLFLVDAEDQNLLWYSKQVIENVPVEMSDLFTLYIAPTFGAQGSTGTMSALAAMDDKLIIFKRNAIYYMTGFGPDNTGANSDFSSPVFITSAVGCPNPQSIVLTPMGLMFQSDKGIWLLGRDLTTTYIGQGVEAYNSYTVMSSQTIPGTTQVRFVLNNNVTLMYDYFYQQWGTHTNVAAISSTLYQGKHTYLNSYGQVLQETAGSYLDNASPVLMSFTTAWINLAGLQGFERFYFFYLLGTYLSPFQLNISVGFNYNPGPVQSVLVTPDNATPNWGGDAQWGSNTNWGGGQGDGSSADHSANVFAARIFPNQQKCESFQVSVQELFDASIGQSAGEGLTLSGLSLIVGAKRGFRTQRAGNQFG